MSSRLRSRWGPAPRTALTRPSSSTPNKYGFIFAFYRYSQIEDASFVQYMVHVATRSDIIHVAVVPVVDYLIDAMGRPYNIVIKDTAFTAYVGVGFEVQPVSMVLTPQYDLMLAPVRTKEDFVAGMSFMRSLDGASYNYMALPLTLLPSALKRMLMHSWFGHTKKAERDPPKIKKEEPEEEPPHHAIFCSQLGLTVCYASNVLAYHPMSPSTCTPGDLARILRPFAFDCSHNRIVMILPTDDEEEEEEE